MHPKSAAARPALWRPDPPHWDVVSTQPSGLEVHNTSDRLLQYVLQYVYVLQHSDPCQAYDMQTINSRKKTTPQPQKKTLASLVQSSRAAVAPTHPFHGNLLLQVEGTLDDAPSVADHTVFQGRMEQVVCLCNLLQRKSDVLVCTLDAMALETLKVTITAAR